MAKYNEIAQTLSDRIFQKVYPADSYLPSESEMQKEFGASRDTVRKALNILADSGKILKEKGKGSKVLNPDVVTFPANGITSFKEVSSLYEGDVQTKVVEISRIPDPDAIEKLQLKPDEQAVRIVRVRSFDGKRLIVDKDYLNCAIVPGITEEIAADSLYAYIENTLHLPISFARKEITVEPAREEDRRLLDLNEYSMVVVVRSYTYLNDATLFQYTESRHRPDKFKFIEISRRERI